MSGLKLVTVLLLALCTATEAAKCRGKYMEMRGREGFVTRGGCRGLDSQIQEEYWTTVGFDGDLRDGRTTDDFLVFPANENNGHTQTNSFVGYWITRSKYGENVHYEAFGHAFIKPDGKVCGWFVGSHKEVVEVCGGFRVLSRSRFNPHQPIPFEWVQGEQYRNRDVLGFHHHKIAKYEANADEVLFGDADVKGKKFNGVSINNEQRVEVDTPETFHRKVWLLRKKSTQPPSDIRIPLKIEQQKRREDLDIYQDPYHEVRITNMRLYPYYDQYGRPSGSQTDSHRPAYDSSGRKLPFDQSTSQNNQISNNYQYYDIQQQPPQSHPGYDEWLRNQYRQRGIIPRGYENNWNQQASNSNQDNQERNEVPAYVLQTRNNLNTNSEDGNSENDSVFYEKQDRQEPKDLSESENSRNSENGETYYSVNPGAPVNEEIKQIKIPGGDDSETVEVSGQSQEKPHVRFIKYHPPTVIRDKKGNSYERIVTDGIAHYFDASGNEVKIDDSSIDRKIEQILENRRRQEEKLRSALEDSDASLSDPVSAAEVARQG